MLKHLLSVVVICASMLLSISGSAQSTGTVLFSSGATQTQLYRVDNPGTASVSATPIGSPYSTVYNGIGYYNGMLYGITLNSQVVSINPTTGVVTLLGISLPMANHASGDIANGILYTSDMSGSAHTLYRINIATGTYSSVPLAGQFADFVYYNGYLYGAAGAQGSYYAYRIDPNTGAMTQLSNIPLGPSAATWSDGTGMIYFDRKGTYNVNTGVATADASTGTTAAGVAGAGSGYDDGTLAPSNSTPLTNGGTIAANQTNCGPYDPAALTSTAPASGGSGSGAIQYRWWANGSLVAGATSITYDPGPITVTTTYQREANRIGTTVWVASNAVTATVENCSPLTNGGTIAADQTNCGPFDPAALTSTAPASGGSGSGAIQYRWWANGSLVAGATSITYDPGPITVTTTYQREANRIGTTGWVASNAVTATVENCSPLTNGGTIAADQTNCGPFDPAALTSTAPASGGSGSGAIQYRWWANGSLVAGATSITYDPGPITVTTTYQREANRIGTTGWVASNAVTATVDTACGGLTNGGTIGSNQTGCGTFDPDSLTSITSASGGTGTGAIQYRWRANGNLITGATGMGYNPGPITATTNYVREANRIGTTTWVASNTVTVTVDSACGVDFTIDIDQDGSSELFVGESLPVEIFVQNLTPVAGMVSFSITKPSASSGLTLTFGDTSGWTVTVTATQYIFTSNSPLAGNGTISVPATINRIGGAQGDFSLNATITSTDDSNPENNNSSITVTKL